MIAGAMRAAAWYVLGACQGERIGKQSARPGSEAYLAASTADLVGADSYETPDSLPVHTNRYGPLARDCDVAMEGLRAAEARLKSCFCQTRQIVDNKN